MDRGNAFLIEQMKAAGGGGGGGAVGPPADPSPTGAADDAFRLATSGRPGSLPFRKELERAFGEDFGGVRAFCGGAEAQAGLAQLQARAAAFDRTLVFRDANPDKELVAHELAHLVQQGGQGGAATGTSGPGDGAEREADDAATAALAGEQVELSAVPGLTIHRSVDTSGGRFEALEYAPKEGRSWGALITLAFTPNQTVEADHVALVQTVRSESHRSGEARPSIRTAGQGAASDAALTVMDPASPGYGTRIDAPDGRNSPVYGSERGATGLGDLHAEPMMEIADDGSERTPGRLTEGRPLPMLGGTAREGSRHGTAVQQALLTDAPGGYTPEGQTYDRGVYEGHFETAALAVDGAHPNTWLGSVEWGYRTDERGVSTLNPERVRRKSDGDPSSAFQAAASQWNGATPGGNATIDLPVPGAAPSTTARDGGRAGGDAGTPSRRTPGPTA